MNSENRRARLKSIAADVATTCSKPTTRHGVIRSSAHIGIMPVSKRKREEENQSWPGPFATARSILRDREARKQDAMNASSEGKSNEVSYYEMYDDLIERIHQSPLEFLENNESKFALLPSLKSLCLLSIAAHIDSIETLDFLSPENQIELSDELLRQNRFDFSVASKMVSSCSETLILRSAATLDEASLSDLILRSAFGGSTNHNIPSSLRHLSINHCGLGFSDANYSNLIPAISNCEILELRGLYRLSEASLREVLSACSSTLSRLDLSQYSGLTEYTMESLHSLNLLRELTLEGFEHLSDHQVSKITVTESGEPYFPHLISLNLSRAAHITDEAMSRIVEVYGPTLTSLQLNDCFMLEDRTIQSIRTHCRRLHTLGLSRLYSVSTEALLALFITGPVSVASDENEMNDNTNDMYKELESSIIYGIGPLQRLNLRGIPTLTDDVIIQITQSVGRSLHELNIANSEAITNRSLVALVKHECLGLTRVNLSFVRQIDDKCLEYLVRHCAALQELSLWGCFQISNRCVQRLRMIRALKILGTHSCVNG